MAEGDSLGVQATIGGVVARRVGELEELLVADSALQPNPPLGLPRDREDLGIGRPQHGHPPLLVDRNRER